MGVALLDLVEKGLRTAKQVSVDHIGLEEASAWKECGTYPSRQPDR